MSVIGTFSKSPDGYVGTIRTMTINVKAKIVANDKNGNASRAKTHSDHTGRRQ